MKRQDRIVIPAPGRALLAAGLMCLPSTIAQADFLPDDIHWFYQYGGPERSEPFVFERAGHYIYAGGLFLATSGNENRKNLSRFNTRTEAWEGVPGIDSTFNGGVWAIHQADDGFIYIGGNFSRIGAVEAVGVARFDPEAGTWSALADASPDLVTAGQDLGPTNGRVFALQKIGDLLYVGGEFTGPAGSPQNEKYIRSYNLRNGSWARLGGGLDSDVRALLRAPNGDLVAGGGFSGALARWNGSSWTVLAGGVRQQGGGGIVRALASGPDGTLYLGGDFDLLGPNSLPGRDIAALRNGQWNALAGGFDDTYVQSNGTTFMSDGVYDLRVGEGGRLYASGDFDASAGRTVLDLRHVALWDGSGQWKSLGSGVGTTGSQIVNCLEILPNGSLLAGGVFNEGYRNAGSARYTIARWDAARDFTDYVPGAAENPTTQIVPLPDGRFEITMRTRPGTDYQVEASADGVVWVPINGAVVDGNGNRQGFNITAPAGAAGRLYRFRATDF